MHRFRWRVLLLSPLLLLTMAFRQVPLQDPPPIAVPQGMTAIQVDKAVRAGLVGRGWVVTGEQPGSVAAQLNGNDYVARIRVDYDLKQVGIHYVDSTNLKYEVKRNGTRLIHTNYMGWMKYLSGDIARNLELLSAS